MNVLYSVGSLFTETWVLLSIAAALGYASIGFIDEWLLKAHGIDANGEKTDAAGKLVLVSGFFGLVVSAVFGLVSFFTDGGDSLAIGKQYTVQAVISGALEIVWLVPYFYAMQRSSALNATPLFQTIPIFSLIFGLTVFGEIPASIHIVGSLVIVAGAFLLNSQPGTFKTELRTVALMLLASAIISLVYFLFKEVTLQGNFVASAFWSGVGMMAMSILIWIGWKPYRDQFLAFVRSAKRKDLGVQFGNEALNAASVLASQLAVAKGPSVMLVTAFNAFHPLFTLAIGWLLAKFGSQSHLEALSGSELIKKTVAILMIAGGTVLVAI